MHGFHRTLSALPPRGSSQATKVRPCHTCERHRARNWQQASRPKQAYMEEVVELKVPPLPQLAQLKGVPEPGKEERALLLRL
jgi:hypothetical protein